MKTGPETEALKVAVRAALALSKEHLTAGQDAKGITDLDERAANEIQNVMRLCLEVCLNERPGHTQFLPAELAVRLASYALSSLPLHEQAEAVGTVCAVLPKAHARRIAQGIRITTAWQTAAPVSGAMQ